MLSPARNIAFARAGFAFGALYVLAVVGLLLGLAHSVQQYGWGGYWILLIPLAALIGVIVMIFRHANRILIAARNELASEKNSI